MSEWAAYIFPYTDDKYGDVIIHQLHNNSKMRTSLDKLADGYQSDNEPVVVSQAELIRRFDGNCHY